MFFEQYSHEPYIAVARFWWTIKPGGREERKDRFPEWHEHGYQALAVMERHLSTRDWFAGDACSIADIALYAYTHVAHEGDFDLAPARRSAPGWSASGRSPVTCQWSGVPETSVDGRKENRV